MAFRFLSPKTPIEQSYLVLPKFAFKVLGCWPESHKPSFYRVLQFLVNSLSVALAGFAECIFGVLTLNELLESMEGWCPGTTNLISVFKMWIFFVRREKLFSLIERIGKLLTADGIEAKREIGQKISATAFLLAAAPFVCGHATNLFFFLTPVINNKFYDWNGDNATLELPFKMILPDILTHYPLYPLTYISMIYSGLMTVFTFSAVDGCFVSLCFYLSALFKMIQYDIQQVFAYSHIRTCGHHRSSQDNLVVRHKLKAIIRRHNEVIDLCHEFTVIFRTIIMGHFLSAALVLCVSVIDLLFNTGIGKALYVSYSIAALAQLFLYCIGGSYVTDSSLDICDSVYGVEWYECDVKTRKMLLMMMMRSQRPTSIKVPFFTPSLPAFMAILSTTGSYIALMKSFI